jgi:hypothetical protein
LNSLPLHLFFFILVSASYAQSDDQVAIKVKHTQDFIVTGEGNNSLWQQANWNILSSSIPDQRSTRFKILYSGKGLYFLFQNDDSKITATKNKDFEQLWLEDVVEVFLWPDTTVTLYFEYEISPLNFELPLMVPNLDGKFMGWLPWGYEGERRVTHFTHVGSEKGQNEKTITRWFAEFFIPYKLLQPLRNVPPQRGSTWKANMYRIDYDTSNPVHWQWRKTDKNFHQYTKFGTLIFE